MRTAAGAGGGTSENASSSTGDCRPAIVTLGDEFEKDNFSGRFAIRRI